MGSLWAKTPFQPHPGAVLWKSTIWTGEPSTPRCGSPGRFWGCWEKYTSFALVKSWFVPKQSKTNITWLIHHFLRSFYIIDWFVTLFRNKHILKPIWLLVSVCKIWDRQLGSSTQGWKQNTCEITSHHLLSTIVHPSNILITINEFLCDIPNRTIPNIWNHQPDHPVLYPHHIPIESMVKTSSSPNIQPPFMVYSSHSPLHLITGQGMHHLASQRSGLAKESRDQLPLTCYVLGRVGLAPGTFVV